MNNIEGLVLKQILTIESRDEALEAFSKIREKYFSPAFSSLYKNIQDFYEAKGKIPSIADLKVYRARDLKTLSAISSIELIEDIDVDLDLALDALADQFAQNKVLDLLSSLVKNLPIMNRQELQEQLAGIPLTLDEELDSAENIFTLNTLTTFTSKEETDYTQIFGGISNLWDSRIGYRRQELALFGGKRGSGKSILCANLVSHQMDVKNLGVYFTIEMTAAETYQRIQSIRTQIPFSDIRHNVLNEKQIRTLAKNTADMYVDGDLIYEKHFVNNPAPNQYEFEKELKSTCSLKEDGRLIIVDDRNLSLSTIDVQLNKLKAKYGDKLQVAVVDYLNQINLPGHSGIEMYDWKIQTIIAKQLKNLARKYDILIASPYQIDDTGATRFAKGILDACDTAQIIMAHDKEKKALTLTTTKARSGNDNLECTVGINWDTITINPSEVVIDNKHENEEDDESPFQIPKGAMEVI